MYLTEKSEMCENDSWWQWKTNRILGPNELIHTFISVPCFAHLAFAPAKQSRKRRMGHTLAPLGLVSGTSAPFQTRTSLLAGRFCPAAKCQSQVHVCSATAATGGQRRATSPPMPKAPSFAIDRASSTGGMCGGAVELASVVSIEASSSAGRSNASIFSL